MANITVNGTSTGTGSASCIEYSLLGDSPVLEAKREDLLAFEPAAGVLAKAAVGTFEPLTIGVFGEWGSGKTSMMRLIKSKVQEYPNAAAVWFNAWQYEKEEHLIVPLIATIIKELSTCTKKNGGWKDYKKGVRKVGKALRAIAYGFSVKGEAKFPFLTKLEVAFSGKDMIQRYEDVSRNISLSRSLYFNAFEELRECQEHADVCKIPRIVLFVDDLDRCFPDKAVSLLEVIKLILHQPGFSFVIGVNEKIIEDFVRTKYNKDFNIDGSHFDKYLDKIVQVKYYMPKRETDGMKEYIKSLLKQVKIFPAQIVNDAISLIAEACQHNPRSVIRLLNRVMVTHLIGEAEGRDKSFDSLALLIHIATDEPHYAAFRMALDVITVKEAQEGQEGREEKAKEIGQHVVEAIGGDSDNETIKNRLRTIKMRSREDEWKQVVETIARSVNLLNVLKSDKGRQWLEDSLLRRTLSEASQSTLEEKKAKAVPVFDSSDPIDALLKNMVKIPAGTFVMGGDVERNEQPIREVALQAFEIGAMPVTQEQYEALMGVNPSSFKGPKHPVKNLSWREAMEFCKKLSEITKRGFSLPSEAQWEYACRAGSNKSYCFGDDAKELGEYAWYEFNSGGQTHPVGEKTPNHWGLYDMHGNVWEWCLDHWHSDYEEAPRDGSAWISEEEESGRVIRGGSWGSESRRCRSASRDGRGLGSRRSSLGFRIVALPSDNK